MDANEEFELKEICFVSHVPVKSEIPTKTCFKDIRDLEFNGMSDHYINYSMARVQGSRYLMNAGSNRDYFVDTSTLTANKADIDIRSPIDNHYNIRIENFTNCFIEGEYMLLVGFFGKMAILRGLQYIGQIEFQAKVENCKNDTTIYGRYAQQVDKTVYVVDLLGDFYRIEWQDIKDGNYQKTLVVKSNVENFFVDRGLGLAIVNENGTLSLDNNDNGTLSLDNKTEVELQTKFNPLAKWKIVTCVAKCWIVSGDCYLDGHAIMASISKKSSIKSTQKIKLTSNGYKGISGSEYGGIYALRKVYITGMRGIMIAIERDGCCHLMSVDFGRLTVLQSIDSIVDVDMVLYESENIVHSVTAARTKGEFIVGGCGWTRVITVKYK